MKKLFLQQNSSVVYECLGEQKVIGINSGMPMLVPEKSIPIQFKNHFRLIHIIKLELSSQVQQLIERQEKYDGSSNKMLIFYKHIFTIK